LRRKTNPVFKLGTVFAAILLISGVTAAGLNNLAFATTIQKFTVKLSGSDELSPVNTPATGTAHFELSSDGKVLNYDLSTTNLKGFMMAHIHQGKTGENGPPVAELSMGKGKITSSDLKGPLEGKQLSDLVNLLKSGGAYVNVHTQQNQNGEIRGQIS